MSTTNDDEAPPGALQRRSLIKRAALVVTAAVAGRPARRAALGTTALGPPRQSPSRLSSQAKQQGDPYATFLPSGYSFVQRFDQPRLDGWNAIDEFALWFKALRNPAGYNFPLSIFFTRLSGHTLLGTELHDPIRVELNIQGEIIQAGYHDGWWRYGPGGRVRVPTASTARWDMNTMHSLVFAWRGFDVGIRGARNVGVDAADLIAVANGLRA